MEDRSEETIPATQLPLGRPVVVKPPSEHLEPHRTTPTRALPPVEARQRTPGAPARTVQVPSGSRETATPRRPLSARQQSLELDARQLRHLSTPDLMKRLVEEARLLVRAEVLVARQELRDEVASAKTAGILAGAGLGLALSGLALLFVALAAALPLALWLAALLVGIVLLGVAGLLAWGASRKAPTRPMARSQERLKRDFALTRESLQ